MRPVRHRPVFTSASVLAFRCTTDQVTIRDTIRDTGMGQATMLRAITGDPPGTSTIATRTGTADIGAIAGGTIIDTGL